MLRKEPPHVLIVGGGFAGLAAARRLARADVRVTLVDRTNHHLFQPLLYQVATAALAAPDIAAPIRKLLARQRNATVLMAEVRSIQPAERTVELETVAGDTHQLHYDWLILAAGMVNGWFGRDAEWAPHAPGLKSLADALEVRARILRAFEAAEQEPNVERRRAWTTFAVIGAGPTGVELAGALAEIAGRTLTRDFRTYDPGTTRVVLVEAGERVLPTFHESLGAAARRSLERLGVEVRLGQRVTELDGDGIALGTERIATRTVLWAAGVAASPLTAQLGVERDRAGRVCVAPDLSVPGRPEVYVVGDLIQLEQDGRPLPGVCQLAMQSGAFAADNIRRALRNESTRPFRYVDKGSMATIGRLQAVAETNGFRFAGFFAWLLWLFVHILFLVDFRNRMAVLFEWAWAFVTWNRSSRVIIERP